MNKETRIVKTLEIVFAVIGFLAVYLFIREVKAANPKDILAGVIQVKAGVCNIDKRGIISARAKEAVYKKDCAIGIDPTRPTKRYVAIYDKYGKIESIIEGDKPTGTQKVIWRKGEHAI